MSSIGADPTGRKPYHHGSLHSALVEASVALAREGGPDRVILREAARAAGVSHSAAYRHFADREALLADVSAYARNELAAQMLRRVNSAKGPRRRLRAVGTAYIDFALTEPGLFRTAFTSHPATFRDAEDDRATTGEGPTHTTTGAEPFEVLGQVLDEATPPVYWILPSGPERRLPPGQRYTAWPACYSTGPYPRTPQRSNSREGKC